MMRRAFSFRSLRLALLLVLAVLVVGTGGYIWIEHLTPFDALYVTVTLMATVGDSFVPLSPAGRLFAVLILVCGVGSLLYLFGVVMEFVLEGHLSSAVRRHFMENKIAGLRGHYVICGFGRVGSQIAEDLASAGHVFVVVDEREESVEACLSHGYLTVKGDATSDEVLINAGVRHARCLLVATDNDAHNISITLSARHLSPQLQIVSRSNHEETEVKLKLAGANRVLSPYTFAGHSMANLAMEFGPSGVPVASEKRGR